MFEIKNLNTLLLFEKIGNQYTNHILDKRDCMLTCLFRFSIIFIKFQYTQVEKIIITIRQNIAFERLDVEMSFTMKMGFA